jgi:tetratricopeptide (TPR) repeat protein
MTQVRLAIVGDCVIEIGPHRVTPASSHLFGLLLLLTLRDGKPISRQELQTLLADGNAPRHNLRQLLYRLRQMGLRFEDLAAGLTLIDAEIVGPVEVLRAMDIRARSRLTLSELEILPSYLPPLPKLFTAWVDDAKSDIDARIRQLLLVDLEVCRLSHAWDDVRRLAETLTLLDAANEEVVRSRAAAPAMPGHREAALQVLDTFTRETSPSTDASALLQSVRARIAKTAITRRAGTLRARAACLSFLDSEWAQIASEGARVSAVLGVAGLGKTRVAEEFAARIAFRGGHVLRFTCDSQARQQPLSLFSHILPALRAMRGSLGASPEYKASLALVRPANDGMEPTTMPEGLPLEARRADIQSALIDLLEAVTSERALLLVVDDAHLLDEPSRAVLRALTSTRNAAVLQVLVCARPSSGNASLLAPAKRNGVYELAPLSRQDSLELLLELGAGSGPDDAHVAWCLAQAAGNPFYLHQLATHAPSSASALPFDISSLALSSYSSLRPESRAVLETCLLLGRFATMTRAMFVAGIDDHTMLTALRELEEQDLVHFVEGHLSGPHALLHDALRDLIPSSVGALLHRRIAARLEEECVADRFTPELAWASAQSWLAAADPAAATKLLRQCAAHAADVGEPAVAVELLSLVPHSALPPRLLATLLDDLSRFANEGGCRGVVVTSLRDRLAVARALGEEDARIKDLQLRLIEAEVLAGGPLAPAIDEITAILEDSSAEPSVRARAATRLLVIADTALDTALAARAYAWLTSIVSDDSHTKSLIARAEVVYHASFGDVDLAVTLASRLIAECPQPDATEHAIRTRSYAGYAFYRIGHFERAGAILEASYDCMVLHRLYSEALYHSSMRTDVALVLGEFELAAIWFARSEKAARGASPHQLNPMSGFYANAGILAMRQGRYDEAEHFIRTPLKHLSLLTGSRYRAVALAMLLRIEQLRSDRNLDPDAVAELRVLYAKGRTLGSQDVIVEALWCAHMLEGETEAASQLLREYLCTHRHERTLPEWSLRHATAADDAWEAFNAGLNSPIG